LILLFSTASRTWFAHTQYISTISLSRSDTPCAPEVDEDVEDFPFEATAESRVGPAMATTFTEVWKPAPPAQKSAGPTSRRDPRVEDFELLMQAGDLSIVSVRSWS